MRFAIIAVLAILGLTGAVSAQDVTMNVYPGPAPGSEGWRQERVMVARGDGQRIYNTVEPRIEVYLPPAGTANGAAALILPGGGLRVLGRGQETRDLIDLLLANGIAAIHVEYRTLQMNAVDIARASAPPPAPPPPTGGSAARLAPSFPKLEIVKGNANPAKGNAAMDEVLRLATSDAQAVMRIVRAHAQEWQIDPARVGMIGTSAGGGVAFGALLAGDKSAAPDFIVSIYGPSLQDVDVAPDAPPLFLATEADHGPVTDGLVALYQLWHEAGRAAELHIYTVPTFAMPVRLWAGRMVDWLREQAILPAQ